MKNDNKIITSSKKIEKEIQEKLEKHFYDILYSNLNLSQNKINVKIDNTIISLFKNGKIFFKDNFIGGDFNAKISQFFLNIGATWNPKKKGFDILTDILPKNITDIISDIQKENENFYNLTFEKLDNQDLNKSIPLVSNYENEVGRLTQQMQTKFNIEIEKSLSETNQRDIAKQYNDNTNTYSTKFIKEENERLRNLVQNNFENGIHSRQTQMDILATFDVSKYKARFLARQETSLLTASFLSTEYQSQGALKFRWITTIDGRERPQCRSWNNKIFKFDSPPLDEKTNLPTLPGQLFGCRCRMVPIFEIND